MKSLEKNKKGPWAILITFILVVFCILWTLPTVGILVTSFRTADAASSTGWWRALADLKSFTLDNYNQVLFGQRFSVGNATGTQTVRGATMLSAFLSSITVTLPSVIIPILIAAAAAYGFAWLDFKGRNVMFAMIIALLVVPLQISLIPILRDYNKIGLNGSYLGIWLAHTGFGLPLATYMMYNYNFGICVHRRFEPLHDFRALDSSVERSCNRVVRNLPVHLGVERHARFVGLPFGSGSEIAGRHGSPYEHGGYARYGLAFAHSGCVRLNDSSALRILGLAEILRSRLACRFSERLTNVQNFWLCQKQTPSENAALESTVARNRNLTRCARTRKVDSCCNLASVCFCNSRKW